MTDIALKGMTEDEFLDWCEHQEDKYELIDGFPVLKFDNGPEMMAGASERHDQIVINIIQALRGLRGGRCRVKTGDQASRMPRGNLRRPDVTIDCGPREPSSHVSSAPTVLFEVLSPSTRRTDLLRKVDEYQNLPTLRHFVIIEPDRPWAITWSRDASGAWSSTIAEGLDAALALDAVAVSLPLRAVFEDVVFEA